LKANLHWQLRATATIMSLPERVIQEIAAETEDSQSEKARAVTKLEILEAALQTLNHLSRLKLGGT